MDMFMILVLIMTTDVDDVKDIDKYLMKKNNIV